MGEPGPGTQLAGFRIVERLGRGGMGVVYRATEESVGRDVALKLLAPELASDPELVQRFVREARAVAALAHPGITTLFRAGSERGVAFLAFELVPGGSLEDRLKRAGPYAWREASLLASEIARALAAVHAAGVLHRDLKPANVLLDASGHTKLADFGLARRPGEGSRITETGALIGTPAYVAPEHIAGEDASPASDVYALGCLAFALVAGHPPFEASGFSLLKMHAYDAPPKLSSLARDVPRELDRVVAQMLAKRPEERPTSAAVAEELERIARAVPRRALAATVVPWAIAIGAVGVAIAVGARGRSPVSSASPTSSPSLAASAKPAETKPTPVPSRPRSSPPPSPQPSSSPSTSATHTPTQGEILEARSKGEWDRVVELARLRLAAIPKEAYSLAQLAYAFSKQGKEKWAEGEEKAKEAVKQDPNGFEPAWALAEVHRKNASHETAENDYRRAAPLAPKNPLPWQQMVVMYRDMDPTSYDSALKIGAEASRQFPRDVWFLDARADLLGRIGRSKEVLEVYDEGIERVADAWVFYVRRAVILNSLGHADDARRDIEKALANRETLPAEEQAQLTKLARGLAVPTPR